MGEIYCTLEIGSVDNLMAQPCAVKVRLRFISAIYDIWSYLYLQYADVHYASRIILRQYTFHTIFQYS
jgi:hypothetical protein